MSQPPSETLSLANTAVSTGLFFLQSDAFSQFDRTTKPWGFTSGRRCFHAPWQIHCGPKKLSKHTTAKRFLERSTFDAVVSRIPEIAANLTSERLRKLLVVDENGNAKRWPVAWQFSLTCMAAVPKIAREVTCPRSSPEQMAR